MSSMKNLLFGFICLISGMSSSVFAQNCSYRIYGHISTVDNEKFSGYITWGKNQLYWTDLFQALKPKNPYAHYFKPEDGVLFNHSGKTSSVPPQHIFACRFGDIKTIELSGINQINLHIQSGYQILLKKGSFKDINTPISLQISAQEEIEIPWEKIAKIEFDASPDSFCPPHTLPITGIVQTKQGIYKGFISWNKKKTITDTFKAKTARGEIYISFSQIKRILKAPNGYRLILKNGEVKDLKTIENLREITVNMPNIGIVTIPASKLESLNIEEIPLPSYADFSDQTPLYGEILTRKGEKIKGRLAYDLDEAMNFELLEGENDNIEYSIPFKYLQSIEPKNYKYSYITLTNGAALSLGDSVDVDAENSGILIFPEDSIPVYVPWKEIRLITFENQARSTSE